jgi:hypothetical protein
LLLIKGGGMKRVFWVVSLFIFIVIGLHILPVIQELNGKRQTLWPIMAWGMYRYAHPSDKKISVKKIDISARTESGAALDIAPINHPFFFNLLRRRYRKGDNNIALGYYGYNRLFIKPMLKGNNDAARQLADLLNQHRRDRITHIQIQMHMYEMNDAGLEKVDSPIIAYNVYNEPY